MQTNQNADLQALLNQRAELDRQIEAIRSGQRKEAIAKATEIIRQYELTPIDVFGRRGLETGSVPGASTKTRAPVAPKYRDPMTGSTWTGRGKPPKWIDGKDREQFLIR